MRAVYMHVPLSRAYFGLLPLDNPKTLEPLAGVQQPSHADDFARLRAWGAAGMRCLPAHAARLPALPRPPQAAETGAHVFFFPRVK